MAKREIKASQLVVGDVFWKNGFGPFKVLALPYDGDSDEPYMQLASPWGSRTRSLHPGDMVTLDNDAIRKALKVERFSKLVDERDKAVKEAQDAANVVKALQSQFDKAADELNRLRAAKDPDAIRLLKAQLANMTAERDRARTAADRHLDEYHKLSDAARKQQQELEQAKKERDAAVKAYDREKLVSAEYLGKWKAVYSKWEYECQAKIEAQRALARVERELAAMTERAERAEEAYGEACDDPGALPTPVPGAPTVVAPTPLESVWHKQQLTPLDKLVNLVVQERARAKQLHPTYHAGAGPARSGNHLILSEEVGEVARATQEGNGEALKAELTQVATVALAWLAGELGLDW